MADRKVVCLLRLAGCRTWTLSLFPALVGTTLPFWLRPPGFSFDPLSAAEFLVATALFHAGFSFLLARSGGRATSSWPAPRLVEAAGICIVAGCLLGLHLNSGLALHPGVYENIFLLYGVAVLFVGILYVAPPFSFHRRVGGEVVLCEGLGMIPILGAYLVQVGDLTRTVYIASMPLVMSTGLWVWVSELASRGDDERTGRNTMVRLFSPPYSARYGTLILVLLVFSAIIGSVLIRSSVPPLSLLALISSALALPVLRISWSDYADRARMLTARSYALLAHGALCLVVSVASVTSHF